MLPKRVIGLRSLLVRVTLIIVSLALLPASTLDARGTIRLKPDPTLKPNSTSKPDPIRKPEPTQKPELTLGRIKTDSAAPAIAGGSMRLEPDFTGGTVAWRPSALGTIDGKVFDMALGAANCAVRKGAVTPPSTLTVIDYSKPSTAKRLWVFDLRSHELVYEELVAHGQGSGGNVPTVFSNDPDTHRTSLGLFVTEGTYVGKNGYSLRLDGLDRGFNDRARERAIVMHGAPYVSEQFAQAQGRLGRSWGCPALRPDIARNVIDRVKGGGLVFAYYPDQQWLDGSQYLGGCAPAL